MTAADATGCASFELPQLESRLWIVWTPGGLSQVAFGSAGCAAHDALASDQPLPPQAPLPAPYRTPFERYFAGEPVDPVQLPVCPVGTPFQLAVWNELRTIARGEVRSYAAVASRIGKPRAMRAVGAANGKNPIAIAIPCHRVIEAHMQIGGYSAGLHRKRFLLELEGCVVVGETVAPGQLELM
jgi:methylated-DNA-[protein]-cysteine S-methyltransferase